MMNNIIRIGKLAELTGINAPTVRYYEKMGVLPSPKRSDNGYRIYDRQDVNRLQFVNRARAFGFSMDEIQEVLGLREQGSCPCGYVLDQIDVKLAEIEERMTALRELQVELTQLRRMAGEPADASAENGANVCRIIESHQA